MWFRDRSDANDRGTLKLADFGLARFQTSTTRIYTSKSPFSRPYQAPECDLAGGRFGQSHDIWALGCLYLELVTWLLGGWKLVEEFQKKKSRQSPAYFADLTRGTFFSIVGSNGQEVAIVKPAVIKVQYEPNPPFTVKLN